MLVITDMRGRCAMLLLLRPRPHIPLAAQYNPLASYPLAAQYQPLASYQSLVNILTWSWLGWDRAS